MNGVVIGVIAIIIVEIFLATLSKKFKNKRWAKEVLPFIKTTIRFVVLFAFVGVVLDYFGYDVSKIFLGAGGVIGLVIGFGFKDFINNFAAGVWIMIVDPFDVGDRITVKGVTGTVEYVTSLATVIRTDDGKTVYIPNKNIWGNIISVEEIKKN